MRLPSRTHLVSKHKGKFHGLNKLLHFGYLIFVFGESHGVYGYFAGGLAVLTAIGFALHIEASE